MGKKSTKEKPEVPESKNTVYHFRFVEGVEFALIGIDRWEENETEIKFFEQDELILQAQKDGLICWRRTEPGTLDGADSVQSQLNANAAEEARELAIKEGEREGARFVLMPSADHGTLLVDTETDGVWCVPKGLEDVTAYANAGHSNTVNESEVVKMREAADVCILIEDLSDKPDYVLSQDALQEALQTGELVTTQDPVVTYKGRHYHINPVEEGGWTLTLASLRILKKGVEEDVGTDTQ